MQTSQIVDEFKRRLQGLYGGTLKRVILYGSFARGDATEDSDIDVAVVLKGNVNPVDEIDRMIDIVTDLNLEHNVLVSIYPISEDDYSSVNSPILLNLRREGIVA
ncbi:nucleotidyltransferase domain-containing protein [bacterium]|nr:nucleotidyltransferase domain-containing protein [bacterium]